MNKCISLQFTIIFCERRTLGDVDIVAAPSTLLLLLLPSQVLRRHAAGVLRCTRSCNSRLVFHWLGPWVGYNSPTLTCGVSGFHDSATPMAARPPRPRIYWVGVWLGRVTAIS